jgi:predicted GTPase
VRRVIILGAAGRDFHDFNVVFRGSGEHEVVAFTAAQIPHIEGRLYPAALAGSRYPNGIPIESETELERLIEEREVDEAVFAYSDLSHVEVMHLASRVIAAGADFRLLGPKATMLPARVPVVSVCAVRTGAGKSPTSRFVARALSERGLRVVVVRHPMPYGDLAAQAVQRYGSIEDLARERCTIEEMEEYEPHIRRGNVVYAGVDYERILRAAEAEADVVLWDGGNDDLPFFLPDLEIVLVDPHRAGDERSHFPGEANLLRADVVVISKVDSAPQGSVEALRDSVGKANPKARVVLARMPVSVDRPEVMSGKRVLVIEDGPTLTHGGMAFGAGTIAARRLGATPVDPRPAAVGELRDVFARYPRLTGVLPAMGYGDAEVRDLAQTIAGVECDAVVIATPVDLRRLRAIAQPTCRVTYELEPAGPELEQALDAIALRAHPDG